MQKLREQVASGKRRLILQANTGAGKTCIACMMIDSAVAKGKTVLFLAHSRELVHQCASKLRSIGIRCGVIMAGEPMELHHAVQVASKDTLHARSVRRNRLELPPADLLYLDEAHRSTAKTWRGLVSKYPKAIVIGLTATPARGDGSGLGCIYETIVSTCSTERLIADGYLVPSRVFAPYNPNLKGVKRGTDGDYDKGQLETRMDRSSITGDIITHWQKLADNRPTLVFASGISHSMHIRDGFRQAGYRAAHLDGNTPKDDRDEILRRFSSGDIEILSSCDVLSEGVDLPLCSCVVLARPTKSIVKYKQQIGRGMRPFPGKEDLLILDHAGNVHRHGFPDEDIEWTLDGRKLANGRQNNKQPPKEPIVCKKCFCAYYSGGVCPNCGYKPETKGRSKVVVKDGTLVEVAKRPPGTSSPEDMQRYWMYCLRACGNRGSGPRVAAGMFASHYKKPPWQCKVRPLPGYGQWDKRITELYPSLFRKVGSHEGGIR